MIPSIFNLPDINGTILSMISFHSLYSVPESNFVLRYYTSNISNLVMVLCSVYGFFPAPELSLWINEYRLDNITENTLLTQSDLYDSSVSIHLVLYERIQQDDIIKCTLSVKDTDYSKTKETVFIGKFLGRSQSLNIFIEFQIVSHTDVNRDPVPEHNSVFDHISSTTHESPSSSAESTSSTTSPSTSTSSHDPTVASPYSTTPTSRLSNEVYKEPDAVKHPASAVTVPAPAAPRVVQHHFSPSLQPAVVRLKPTPPRIRTAGGEHLGGVDSDEVTNVVNFKEVFNENMLYSSGGSGGEFHY